MISMNYEWMILDDVRIFDSFEGYIMVYQYIMDDHGISPFWESSRSTSSADVKSVLHLHGTMISMGPCDGQVKQIVGGTLKEDSDSLITNFEATQCRSQVLAFACICSEFMKLYQVSLEYDL